MKRSFFLMLAISSMVVAVVAGCRGAACNNCGGYGGGYGAGYGGGYNAQPAAAYPPGTWVPQGQVQQPGNIGQPGVVLPQQVAPLQNQPGGVFGSGGR